MSHRTGGQTRDRQQLIADGLQRFDVTRRSSVRSVDEQSGPSHGITHIQQREFEGHDALVALESRPRLNQ